MLRFTHLTIENFGPYKGIQNIDFPDEDGVTIIWGDNGLGKTTLLNIFRYVLFGYYRNRQEKNVDLSLLGNKEAFEEGDYDFGVTLGMHLDDDEYELSRKCSRKSGVQTPTSTNDFNTESFLQRNGDVLSAAEMDHTLNRIMPDEVSRFFLFDGELLQEYEELLLDETSAGATIKESIEQILGVPVLINGRSDLQFVTDSYEKGWSKAAKGSKETEKIASEIDTALSDKKIHEAELDNLKVQLADREARRQDLMRAEEENERLIDLIKQMDVLEKDIADYEEKKKELLSDILSQTDEIWRVLVGARCRAILQDLQDQIKPLEEKQISYKARERYIDDMRTAAEKHHCDVCDQDVDDEHLNNLLQLIESYDSESEGLSEQEESQFQELNSRSSVFSTMIRTGSEIDLVDYMEKNLYETDVEIDDARSKYGELENELKKYGDVEESRTDAKNLESELVKCLAEIKNLKEGVQEEEEKLKDIEASLTISQRKLRESAKDQNVALAEKRLAVSNQVTDIFEQSINAYREELRREVERDATELFQNISNDKDYNQLKINDNYGLTILHKSGKEVTLRSAGYEHIVALSLIGALHKNAPLSGPIIMDTPFGRLDSAHKKNVVKMLPAMSDQVILLVYCNEIDENETRSALGGALKQEYQLVRRTSFFTEVEER